MIYEQKSQEYVLQNMTFGFSRMFKFLSHSVSCNKRKIVQKCRHITSCNL